MLVLMNGNNSSKQKEKNMKKTSVQKTLAASTLAAKMRKHQITKAFAKKVLKTGGRWTASKTDQFLPDYIPGGIIYGWFN